MFTATEGVGTVFPVCVGLNFLGASGSSGRFDISFGGSSLYSGNLAIVL